MRTAKKWFKYWLWFADFFFIRVRVWSLRVKWISGWRMKDSRWRSPVPVTFLSVCLDSRLRPQRENLLRSQKSQRTLWLHRARILLVHKGGSRLWEEEHARQSPVSCWHRWHRPEGLHDWLHVFPWRPSTQPEIQRCQHSWTMTPHRWNYTRSKDQCFESK